MQRRAKCRCREGLLLVEAALSAVVIALGLIFISRGLSSQLKALRTLEEQDTLLALATGKLTELETLHLFGRSSSGQFTGTFDPPYQQYRWTLAMHPNETLTDPQHQPLADDVALTVERTNPPASAVRLRAVWPREWMSQ